MLSLICCARMDFLEQLHCEGGVWGGEGGVCEGGVWGRWSLRSVMWWEWISWSSFTVKVESEECDVVRMDFLEQLHCEGGVKCDVMKMDFLEQLHCEGGVWEVMRMDFLEQLHCEGGVLRSVMWWEVHLEQNIAMIACLSGICEGNNNKMLHATSC
jgi:hypothetical protein